MMAIVISGNCLGGNGVNCHVNGFNRLFSGFTRWSQRRVRVVAQGQGGNQQLAPCTATGRRVNMEILTGILRHQYVKGVAEWCVQI